MKSLYAAGECACQYHGANRLGGNSLLGALYGGKIAARSAMEDEDVPEYQNQDEKKTKMKKSVPGSYTANLQDMQKILKNGLGIVRDEATLKDAVKKLDRIINKLDAEYDDTATEVEDQGLSERCLLGKAMLLCALERKESRGAHNRSDYPKESKEYQKQTIAEFKDGIIRIHFQKAGNVDDN